MPLSSTIEHRRGLCRRLVRGLRAPLALLTVPVLAPFLAVASLLLTSVVSQGSATATGSASTKSTNSSGNPPAMLGGPLSFAALEGAHLNTDHTMVRLRRFFGDGGQVVSVREELRVDADGTANAPYSLSFLGVEGELPGSQVTTQWAQNYARFASFYAQHGTFSVRNLAKAEANYSLHDFGPVMRAGRPAHRVVVFPNQLDKAVWLLDVDDATMLTLYSAEYDARFRLLGEVEAQSLALTAQVLVPNVPVMSLSTHGGFAAAKTAMGSPLGLVEPSKHFTAEYDLRLVQVADNPLNGRQTLVLTYTDGIDEFFVIESPGVSEFFAGLPSMQKSGAKMVNTIARYRDAAMSILVFWDDGVGFEVTGRGSLQRLDGVAKAVYTQALLGN